ncbi:Carbon-nitrogen hydrolase [Caballeronia arvi]|uniref:Carbon-nitrogen hydrolase n=1 Tax=Caballeronia arvi TaxID=1777135 RepID=A0A158K262_9BURK|nr:nitrilase-related carbon-nitrogen hydrolase [Caballeronia arvi]SAL75218.1 Carbon-nitrogen hydrolase [Caballeronia arvi]
MEARSEAASFRVAVIAHELADRSLIAARLADAARHGVQLAVFPPSAIEEAHAESFDDVAMQLTAAVDAAGVAAGVGWIERTEDGRLYDSYALCFPGGGRARHRKLHATHRRFHGGSGFTVFDAPFGMRIGILIGEDNDVVENVRMTALMGATLLIAPMRGDRSHRATLAARAADNGMYIAYARASSDQAMIVGPDGRVLARHASANDGLIVAQVKPSLAEASSARQALAARRPDLYAPLAQRGNAYPLVMETERAAPRGSLPLSFAIVGRNRLMR